MIDKKTILSVLNTESFHKELGVTNNVDVLYTSEMLYKNGEGSYVGIFTSEDVMSCELVKVEDNIVEIRNYGYSPDFKVYLIEDYGMCYGDFLKLSLSDKVKMLKEYGEAMLDSAFEQYKKVVTLNTECTILSVEVLQYKGKVDGFVSVKGYNL